MEEGHAKGCSKPREGPWGLQFGLEDKGIEEFLAVDRAPLGTVDLALGSLVSRADASSIPRKLGQS